VNYIDTATFVERLSRIGIRFPSGALSVHIRLDAGCLVAITVTMYATEQELHDGLAYKQGGKGGPGEIVKDVEYRIVEVPK
jgi:hypothetical protein